jgi:periplasmic protein TonB
MLAPFLPRFAPSDSKPDSWWTRVHENLRQLTAPGGLSPTSANGAPIHVLKLSRSSAAGQAQTLSLVTHVFALAVLVLFLAGPGFDGKRPISPGSTPLGVLTVPSRILRALGAQASSGSGGDQTQIPPTHGNLLHVSSIQLVRPSLPQNHRADLPVPPTILDSSAAPVLISIDNIGLPWMSNVTNSAGPGKGHTIGSADGSTMGDSKNGPAGYGDSVGPYAPATIMPTCLYCPLPMYTEEARQVKMQGTVTMRVLVGADGRASDIRIVRGVGFGLDERAMQTVRTWKFSPARDPSHGLIAAWITIEAVFRLF